MSKSYALIRFYKTGNIYYGVYNGTVDTLYFNICTAEDCYDKELDGYYLIHYLCNKQEDVLPKGAPDLDDVDIYTSYGGGFYWKGRGSESLKMVLEGLSPWEFEYDSVIDGKPDWAERFLSVNQDVTESIF